MELAKLREYAQQAINNEHYQHKSITQKERDSLAVKSFLRISEEDRKKITNVWINSYKFDVQEMIWLRFLAQTNLFFLCKLLEKYKDVTEYTHEEICNSFFVQKNPIINTIEEFCKQYIGLKERLLLVPRGGFKALDLDTEIPTPTGFVLMKDIKVGDSVIGDDGRVCNVTGMSDVFEGRKCYEVLFSTGERIVADADHLWITDSRKDRDRLKGRNNKNQGPKPSVKTTKEIKNTLMCRKEHNHRVSITKPVEYSQKTYTISSYVLGCWLGDGTSSNSNLTCYDNQIIQEILNEGEIIRESDYTENLYVFNGGEYHIDYRSKRKSLAARLRQLNLLNNKHIPNDYMLGSYNQRLGLLQGLMDTDGSVDERGQCYFSNTNRILAYQVRELIASLGLKPFNVCEYDAVLDGRIIGKAYQVGFVAYKGTNVFRLKRKLDKLKEQKKTTLSKYRQIVEVNEVKSRPTKCIMVDSPNNTYLVGRSYIPTHNSSIDMADVIQWIICFPDVTILVLTGVLDLAKDFVREIRSHFLLEDSGKVDNRKKPIYLPKKLGDGTYSMFQILFPEHCVRDIGSDFEFQTPACKEPDKEQTITAASIEQSLVGWHYWIMKLDDVVTNENSLTLTRLEAVNKQVSINIAMLRPIGFLDKIGTWYNECLDGNTLITMGDWTQKPIKDIKVGDEVVGWEPFFKGSRKDKNSYKNGRACLVKSYVTHIGKHENYNVNKYIFKSGRSIIATPDHRWFNRKCNYGYIGLDYNQAKYVRRLFIPTIAEYNKDSSWLAGIFDGEGTFQKQRDGYPSGTIKIAQTLHNPTVVDEIRNVLGRLGFCFKEDWKISKKEGWSDKCDFIIAGGWRERYKFITEINPIRKQKIVNSLFSQLQTYEDELIAVEPAGQCTVYFFGTTTGNYLADGCCSKNSDIYGKDVKHEEKLKEDGDAAETLMYIRSCWVPTEDAKKQGKIEAEMTKADYILWFPEELSYEFLIAKKKKDPDGFAIKYLNDPRLVHQIKFPRELLIRRTINANMLPQQGMIVTSCDTAYSTKSWADYTVLITSIIYGGRFYIIDMVRGKFNEYELPTIVASTGFKWKPKRIVIEDSVGVRWFGREVRREMDKLGISIPVEFVPLGQGNKTKSKEIKAKPVLRLLGDERLLFSNSCAGLDELYSELEKFGTASSTHDDIVSGLSILVDQFAAYADMDAKINFASTQYTSDQRSKEKHDMIYGLGKYSQYNASFNTIDEHPVTQYEVNQQTQISVDSDPLENLF